MLAKQNKISKRRKSGRFVEDRASLVGKRVTVYWNQYDEWYRGKIIAVSPPDAEGTHDVLYDLDGEVISEKLVSSEKGKKEEFYFIGN